MTDLITVEVFEPDGVTSIAPVPRCSGVTWMDEVNTPGTGQFVLHLDDPVLAAHPTLLAANNIVVFTRAADGFVEKTWRIEAHTPVGIGPGENAGRLTTVSGRGLLAGAEKALVWPYALAQASASDVRIFGYGSPEPLVDWADPSLWFSPEGVRQDSDPTARGGFPKPWRDPDAQWIAPTDPTLPAPLGPFWARGSFTLASPEVILIEVSADNFLEVWLDGERIILGDPVDPYNWRRRYAFSRVEAAGTHVIAARVVNAPLLSGSNPTGFLCTVWACDDGGNPVSNVLRSEPASFEVTDTQPGWTVGGILLKLFDEAQSRGVSLLQGVTFGFTKDVDSNGDPWTLSSELPLTIGDDLGKIIDQSTELVCDIWMDGLELNAAPRQGTDRSGTVTFTPGVDVLLSAPTFRAGGVVNAALIHFGPQWIEVTDPATIGDYRAEVSLQLGTVESATQATVMALAQFVETATPEITIPIQSSSARGPQPGVDYFLGDSLTGPGLFGESGVLRVMSITGTVNEGEIRYDNACYPEV